MPKGKAEGKGGGLRPPLPSHRQPPIVSAEEIRQRIIKLTSAAACPDPLAVRKMDVVSTGFLSLDHALKVGGWVQGRLHVVEGETGSGKTALIAACIGAYQRAHPTSVHAFLDVEGTASTEFFARLGTNVHESRFIIFKPESAEEAFFIGMSLLGYKIEKNSWIRDPAIVPVSSITYDSWAGSPVDTVGMAPLARVGAEWWPRIVTKAGRVGTTLFTINQLREKPGVSFGDPRYGPGGKTFKFSQTTCLWVTKSNVIKAADKSKTGHDLRVDIQKTKVAAPSAPLFLTLDYEKGFDFISDAVTYLELRGISFKETNNGKEGNILTFEFTDDDGETQKVRENGRTAFIEAIRENKDAGKAFLAQARNLAAQSLTD